MKKKIIILGIAAACLCMATACSDANKNNNSGSMAESSAQQRLGDLVSDAADGITDITDNLFGKNDQQRSARR